MYLLIENLGEAQIESFTLLGASSARGTDTEKLLPSILRHYTYDVQGMLVKTIEAMRIGV